MSEPLPAPAPAPNPITRLLAPRLSLASCVRAYIVRSTVQAPLADPAQRLNRFPATPFCAIAWYVAGEAELVAPPRGPDTPPWQPVLLLGPQTQPTVTYNPGPVHLFMVVLFPQALHALCGLELPDWVDHWAGLSDVLGPRWAAMSDAVLAAPDDEARVAVLESFLEPLWQQARLSHPGSTGSVAGDWVRRLAVQAAAAGWGRGVRNIERRIKAWAGQPMRRLRRLRRAEQSFLDAREAVFAGKLSWTEVADRAGYADQAHFSRETREVTGASPSEIARLGMSDESYWLYRIWA
ncbi:MAG: helix-turn-helix domain-containing protein [Pseudomonadota bacterium]